MAMDTHGLTWTTTFIQDRPGMIRWQGENGLASSERVAGLRRNGWPLDERSLDGSVSLARTAHMVSGERSFFPEVIAG